jgi:hypothetical protein
MSFDVSALSAIKQEYDANLSVPFLLDNILLNPANSLVRVQPNVKGTYSVNVLTSTIATAVGHCGITTGGTDVLSQVDVTVTDRHAAKNFCVPDLNDYWASQYISPGSYENTLGGGIEGSFFGEQARRIAKVVEDQACTDILSYINTNSGSSNVVAATAMTIANASVVADTIIDSMIANAPELTELENVYLYMSTANFHALRRNYAAANKFHTEPLNGIENSLRIDGTNVTAIGLGGFSTNEMLLTASDNIIFATDVMEEGSNDFDIWYSKDERMVKMYSAWKQGAAIVFPQFCVYAQVQ